MGFNSKVKNSVPFVTILMIGTMLGCGSGNALPTVKGTVTLDGIAVPNAKVSFYPIKGRASLGVTNNNGKYSLRTSKTLPGTQAGNYRVTISTARPSKPGQGADAVSVPAVPESLSTRFSFIEDSVLTGKVELGDNTIDFRLKTQLPD